jgi:hypothetical protein
MQEPIVVFLISPPTFLRTLATPPNLPTPTRRFKLTNGLAAANVFGDTAGDVNSDKPMGLIDRRRSRRRG